MTKTSNCLDFNDPENLIDQLDKRFAKQTFDPTDKIELIMYHSGQRSIIEYLRTEWAKQKGLD